MHDCGLNISPDQKGKKKQLEETSANEAKCY